MHGTYQTKDNCNYLVYEQKIAKTQKYETLVRCIKSTVRDGQFEPFRLVAGQLERNIKSGAWTKIEQ